MGKVNFFSSITYSTAPSKSIGPFLLEKVDDYFYLGGKKAYVIQGKTKKGQEEVVLCEAKSSLLVTVGKVVSYFTLVLPLFMLITKAVLRSTHHFKVIDAKQELEKGINVSEDIVAKIKKLMPKIISSQHDSELEWLSTGNNLVFKLTHCPSLVFKIGKKTYKNDDIKLRFENMVKAKEVCMANELGLLIIPHAKELTVCIEGQNYSFIVEENLEFNPNESAQEELYHTHSTTLNDTARHLAILIAKTGFNDVAWRNIPILEETKEFTGSRRVALIDLEHMYNPIGGFIGDSYNRSEGLIHCVSEEQIDCVIEEARKQGIPITEQQAYDAKTRRLEEIESDKKLRTFYEDNEIITGKEAIEVDIDSLGLDFTQQDQITLKTNETLTFTLRKTTEEMIEKINQLIKDKSDQASKKGKRLILLPSSDYKTTWAKAIITALIDKGYIFKLNRSDLRGFLIQA